MNQELIGKFISKKRKGKKLTQESLVEKLGVSINAVSKWERGICLMDMSLLKPLSDILDVSINEILAGEEIRDEELKSKAEENIINLTELYDLKSSKSGVFAFSVITLLLLIYCGKKDINTLPIVMIWFVYNLGYSFNKYKFTSDKKGLVIALLYSLGLVVTAILFLIQTF